MSLKLNWKGDDRPFVSRVDPSLSRASLTVSVRLRVISYTACTTNGFTT